MEGDGQLTPQRAMRSARASSFSSHVKHPARTLIRLVVKPIRQLRKRHKGPLARWRGRLLNCRAAIRRFTLRHVTFIAVTGSCGKTTTIALSKAVLSSAGTCWTRVGSSRWLVAETILSVGASTKFCLQELHASFPGIIGESLSLLKPQIGVVTTVGGDHYTNYRGLEATAREKGQLVERLPQSGVAILNADDPHVLNMAGRTRARLVTFGLSPQADVRAMEVSSVWPDRLSMKVAHQHETIRIETQMVGGHWVTSVLAAIATGIVSGVDLKFCAEAIRTVKPVFGRYSVHRRSDDAAYVLDTHKAPLWTIAPGLAFVRTARAPRKTMVFGTISDYPGARSPRYRRVAREALEVADRVIFVGPQSSHVDKLRRGEVGERVFTFETTYQASAFMAEGCVPAELIYIKASLTDHLERIMLSQLDEVVCWRERCGKWPPCTGCKNYRKAARPPFDVVQMHASIPQSSFG
jgi:UDP-N-acetylmuramoyl-tripeptide--D-alanyl-D-alanine ligase